MVEIMFGFFKAAMSCIEQIRRFFKILIFIFKYGIDAILKDPLTGVYSTFFLGEFGKIRIRRAERYGLSLCIIMFDLDGLKQINDGKGGHDAGDKALKAVVNAFQEIFCRTTDIFFRIGGDEFLILLEISESGLKQLLEKVRKKLKNLSLFASTGTCFWKKDMTLKELRKRADDNLYAEKNSKKKKPGEI